MNMIKSKTFFLILSITAILSSCGRGNSSSKKSFDPLATVSAERLLGNDELGIATRICYAYKDKSQKFRTTTEGFYGSQFVFGAKKTDCLAAVSNYSVKTNLRYNDLNVLVYVPQAGFDPSLEFNKRVQTDTSGYLAQVCTKVFTNQPLNNTTTTENIKVQIAFFVENGLDGYLLNYFVQQPDGKFKIDSGEKIKVVTSVNPSPGQIRGMDQFYSTQKICSSSLDKKPNSDFEQSFTSR